MQTYHKEFYTNSGKFGGEIRTSLSQTERTHSDDGDGGWYTEKCSVLKMYTGVGQCIVTSPYILKQDYILERDAHACMYIRTHVAVS